MARVSVRRASRWLSPAGFVLAGLCFLLPFVSISCVPGGYGRSAPDGSTVYTGADLVVGGKPAVDKLRPADERRDDLVTAQPLAVVVVVLIAVGAVVATVAKTPRVRRASVASVAAVAGVLLVANQTVVKALLVERVRSQLTQPIPAEARIENYVGTRDGFWLCLVLLAALTALNLEGWLRLRRPDPSRPVAVPGQPALE
jgi:hypothetical protein